eukprot:scaffold15739_cov120-Isochrysis_galbana.AAC.2
MPPALAPSCTRLQKARSCASRRFASALASCRATPMCASTWDSLPVGRYFLELLDELLPPSTFRSCRSAILAAALTSRCNCSMRDVAASGTMRCRLVGNNRPPPLVAPANAEARSCTSHAALPVGRRVPPRAAIACSAPRSPACNIRPACWFDLPCIDSSASIPPAEPPMRPKSRSSEPDEPRG